MKTRFIHPSFLKFRRRKARTMKTTPAIKAQKSSIAVAKLLLLMEKAKPPIFGTNNCSTPLSKIANNKTPKIKASSPRILTERNFDIGLVIAKCDLNDDKLLNVRSQQGKNEGGRIKYIYSSFILHPSSFRLATTLRRRAIPLRVWH